MYINYFCERKVFRTQVFAGCAVFVFKITISEKCNPCSWLLFYQNLFINRLLTSVFVPINGIVFNT